MKCVRMHRGNHVQKTNPRALERNELSLGPSRAHERKKLALGSCALAWAVKEVPDSEAGPPAAELPRQTDIDPFAQCEARKARARSRKPQCRFGGVRLHFSPWQSVGSGQRSTDRTEGVRQRGSGEGSWRYHGSAGLGCSVAPVGGEGLRQTDVKSDTRLAGAESLAHNATNHGSSEFIAW